MLHNQSPNILHEGGLFVARFTGQAGLAAAIIYFHIDSNTLNCLMN
jgi:hypothetical protein